VSDLARAVGAFQATASPLGSAAPTYDPTSSYGTAIGARQVSTGATQDAALPALMILLGTAEVGGYRTTGGKDVGSLFAMRAYRRNGA